MIHTNPHNTYSIRSLSALKIVDRFSCYAVGFNQATATKTRLAALFGQFGEVTSIRIIQNRKPFEVYLRFTTKEAAARAVAWCNDSEQAPINAKHGYNKYCIKFINNKQCRKDNCPNQHQWVSPEDILERPKPKAQPTMTPSHSNQNPHQTQSPAPAPFPLGDKKKWRDLADLQQRFLALQTLFSQQNSTVQSLLSRVNNLKQQNDALRMENHTLSVSPKPSTANDETVMDKDMAELVDFVIADNAVPSMSMPTAAHSNGYAHGPRQQRTQRIPTQSQRVCGYGAMQAQPQFVAGVGAYGVYPQAQAQPPRRW